MSLELKGAPVAEKIRAGITEKMTMCRMKGVEPMMAIVRVGDRSDDVAYEIQVRRSCEKVGLSYKVFDFPEDITQARFEVEFSIINADPNIHGILLFRPLPASLDEGFISSLVDPGKDIDCMNPENLSRLFLGREDAFPPCTSEAVVEMLKYYEIPLEGANVVIVNRSMVLGKPLAMLLLQENATVTVCHSRTKDLPSIMKRADIVVSGIGKARFFDKTCFSKKNTVIDVGINFIDGRMTGDTDPNTAEVAAAVSPVPGGVGSGTTMILMRHAVDSAWRKANG
ncbi:MAG: bifunctional 5,10-methylenetetrahydrofolate dehydrogenase/5,10-methenyltetrahydrofolate cyclohydrolase [Firmicutes bacterium]|nr:bifunctional 5,10-methylenetetrahydrofolate dehydrogenase/5,10-methenyltetrahydrofolate cyclohydrolase [Bacillota bacterium]